MLTAVRASPIPRAPPIVFRARADSYISVQKENLGKWNGVTNFRYYGELMRPELSNLHVRTLGFGVKPSPESSIDLAWHDYRLDETAAGLITGKIGDGRSLDLGIADIGEEWDLVYGFEELENWEFELGLSTFKPGSAFPIARDRSVGLSFKVKWVF